MNRDAAKVIGRNIGIAGSVAGVSGAVGTAIAKSSLPPLQKAGLVVGAAIAGGGIHVGTSLINRMVNTPRWLLLQLHLLQLLLQLLIYLMV